MANYVIYTRKNGDELKLRITAERAVEFEERASASLLAKTAELDKLAVAADYIAAALPEGEYKDRKRQAFEIYDEMTEDGEGLQEYTFLIFDIMVASGFLKSSAVNTQKEAYIKAQEVEEAKAAALLRKAEKTLAVMAEKESATTTPQT